MNGIINFIQEYIGYNSTTGQFSLLGLIKLIIDSLLVILSIIFVLVFLVKHTKNKSFIIMIIVYAVVFGIVSVCGLIMFQRVLIAGIIIYAGMLVVNYAPEIKSHLRGFMSKKGDKGFIADDAAKEKMIDTLLRTVEYLTARKIGAIITIEKENSLNNYIDKASKIDSIVSFELLSTIFFPNTALHDGAVIIRGARIMCAGAFYPSSEKADLPKQYGSRHRAGLGISEVSDAFTIILSEETGKIATTIGGTITSDASIDSLKVSLEQNIIVK